MDNAEANYSLPLTPRIIDGGSGMLDVSRQIKEKVKNWSYAWRMTGNTKWANRVYEELNVSINKDCTDNSMPQETTQTISSAPTTIRVGTRSTSSMWPKWLPPLLSAMIGATTNGRTTSARCSVPP